MIREVPRYTQIDQMFQDISLSDTRLLALFALSAYGSRCQKMLVTPLVTGMSFAYLLTKRIESIYHASLSSWISGQIDSVGIVLTLRSWLWGCEKCLIQPTILPRCS